MKLVGEAIMILLLLGGLVLSLQFLTPGVLPLPGAEIPATSSAALAGSIAYPLPPVSTLEGTPAPEFPLVYPSLTPWPSWTPIPTNTARPGPKSTDVPEIEPANNPAGQIIFLSKNTNGKKNAVSIEVDDKVEIKTPKQEISEEIIRGGLASVSPDGKLLIVWDPMNFSVYGDVWSLRSGKLLAQVPIGSFLGWFPDSRQILLGGGGGSLSLLDPLKNEKILVAAHQYGAVIGAAASPDGRKIIYSYNDNRGPAQTWMVDADGRNSQMLMNRGSRHYSWSPDGKLIAWLGNGLNIMTPAGVVLHTVMDNQIWISACDFKSPLWSPDSRYLLSVIADPVESYDCETPAFVSIPKIYLIDTIAGTASVLVEGGFDPTWSPDGRQIAFVSTRSGASEIWVINLDGTNLRQLTNDHFWVRFPTWKKPLEKLRTPPGV